MWNTYSRPKYRGRNRAGIRAPRTFNKFDEYGRGYGSSADRIIKPRRLR